MKKEMGLRDIAGKLGLRRTLTLMSTRPDAPGILPGGRAGSRAVEGAIGRAGGRADGRTPPAQNAAIQNAGESSAHGFWTVIHAPCHTLNFLQGVLIHVVIHDSSHILRGFSVYDKVYDKVYDSHQQLIHFREGLTRVWRRSGMILAKV